ncbi:MAG: GNAT family acetyltransferase [Candidatus Bathyarchaeota archaeon]|nr:MAG: GNAT family acetyltransferase [Candidatus Bathyarchaeota archaeon]
MSFEIISYDSKYQKAVIDLWKKCDLVVPQNDPVEDIHKKLEFQPELFFIALLKNKVIGSVMTGYDGHRGWLYYLAVLPEYQKRGYGRQLVEKAVKELRKLGCLKANLQVRTDNASVVNFYKHLGFKMEERVSLGMRLKAS